MRQTTLVLFSALGVVTTLLPLRPAHAHQQWLMPNFFVAAGDDERTWLSFEHALGDDRFIPSLGPGPALLWVTGPNDERTAPSSVFTGKTRTVAEVELVKPGTYSIVADEPPSYWTKLKEGGKTRWVPQSRDRVSGKKIEVSKRYWTKSITYVTFRKPTRGPLTSRGDPVELMPVDHPNEIIAKQPFRVRVLSKDAPLPGRTIKVYGEATKGHDPTFIAKSGADGRSELRFPEPGRYLVSVTYEVPAKNDPKADAYSYSVNLMIEAKPKSKAKSH